MLKNSSIYHNLNIYFVFFFFDRFRASDSNLVLRPNPDSGTEVILSPPADPGSPSDLLSQVWNFINYQVTCNDVSDTDNSGAAGVCVYCTYNLTGDGGYYCNKAA